MGKKLVYICDIEGCGAILVNATDGYVVTGVIKATTVDGEKLFVKSPNIDTADTPAESVF